MGVNIKYRNTTVDHLFANYKIASFIAVYKSIKHADDENDKMAGDKAEHQYFLLYSHRLFIKKQRYYHMLKGYTGLIKSMRITVKKDKMPAK